MGLSMRRRLHSQQEMLGDFPDLEICSQCQQVRLPWPWPPGAMLLGMKVSPHWGTYTRATVDCCCSGASHPQWALVALPSSPCVWPGWPKGKGWSLSSLGSCFSWEETGDDRTGVLLSTLCPVSRYRLTMQVLQREVTVKTPGNENKVLFSRIP